MSYSSYSSHTHPSYSRIPPLVYSPGASSNIYHSNVSSNYNQLQVVPYQPQHSATHNAITRDEARAQAKAEVLEEHQKELEEVKKKAAEETRKAAQTTQEKRDAQKLRAQDNLAKRRAEAEAQLSIVEAQMKTNLYRDELEEKERMADVKRKLEASATATVAEVVTVAEVATAEIEGKKGKGKYICKRFNHNKTNAKVKWTAIFIIFACIITNGLLVHFSKDLEVSE